MEGGGKAAEELEVAELVAIGPVAEIEVVVVPPVSKVLVAVEVIEEAEEEEFVAAGAPAVENSITLLNP